MTSASAQKPYQIVWETLIAEGTTPRIKGVLQDHDGNPVPESSLTAVTLLALYDQRTNEIINSKEDVDIKNDNGGTVDADGNLTLKLAKQDTVIVKSRRASEVHVALIEFTWDGGDEVGLAEILHTIGNIHRRP